jgi:hypothetical protein
LDITDVIESTSSNSIHRLLIFPNILTEYENTSSNINNLNFGSLFNGPINLENINFEYVSSNINNLNFGSLFNEPINLENINFERISVNFNLSFNTPINLENIDIQYLHIM